MIVDDLEMDGVAGGPLCEEGFMKGKEKGQERYSGKGDCRILRRTCVGVGDCLMQRRLNWGVRNRGELNSKKNLCSQV